jgi:hypothetical protein
VAFLSGIAGSLGGVGLGAAIVEVAVNTTALTTGLEKAKAEVAASTAGMSASSKAIGTGFIVAGAAAVLGMGKAVSATEKLGMATLNLQRITGQSAESASSLLAVADTFGVSTQSLSSAFGSLAKNVDAGSKVLTKFDLELTNSDGTLKDFNVILGVAADKYVALGGGLQGAAFAQELFGRGGKALIPILEQGSAGIASLEEEAKRYGIVLSQDTVNQVLELTQAHRDLDSSVQGLQVSIGVEVVPALTAFVHGLTDLVVFAQKVPGPVYVAVGSFVAATGALFLLQKAIALVGATWAPVTGAFAAGTTAAAANAVAVTADTAALKLYVANASGVVVAERAVTAATVESTAAITAAGAATTGWLAKLALFARGGATGIGGIVAPFNVALPQTSEQESGEAQALIAQAEAQHNTNEELAQSANLLHLNAEAIVKARTEHITYTAALAELATGAASAAGAEGDLAGADADAAAAAADATAAAVAQKNAQDALAGGIVGLVGDMASVNAAQKEVNDLRRAGNLDTARGRAALITLANATQGYNADLQTELDNIRLVPGHFQAAKEQVQKLGRQMGLTGGELKDFVSGALEAVRSKLNDVRQGADDVNAALSRLDGKKVNIDIITHLLQSGKI